MVEKVIIMGAAGRDFHNFNVYFRDNPRYLVKAFTATQIPDIDGRRYPAGLAGELYPEGIPIHPEEELTDLIEEHGVDLVAFSYSDIPHIEVMHKASAALAKGADFILLGATYTMLKAQKPVIAVCAVRTGCGKSQVARKVCDLVAAQGLKPVAIRHPMPYGDLTAQAVQRFSSYEDFDKHHCTIEEREEYEPLVAKGIIVYAGVDYGRILARAEAEADVIIWDGGNNDTPFFQPDILITVFDPHRAGHELTYYPGQTNMLMADLAVINKVDSAPSEGIAQVQANLAQHNPKAQVILAESALIIEDPSVIKGKKVLIVEDGPTLTHGGMGFGAGHIAATRYGAGEIVDPRPFIQGRIKETFLAYPHLKDVIPAMGYSPAQIADLEASINRAEADLVLFATPIDLPRLLKIEKPFARVRYEYADHQPESNDPTLAQALGEKLAGLRP